MTVPMDALTAERPAGTAAQFAFEAEVSGRFGVLPNFFRSAPEAPGLIHRLWAFARAAYLDSPMPSLFKERLFVHLSRFCEVRYCIVRHVGFLVGCGYPAGDATARPMTIEQVVALLRRPVSTEADLDAALARLEAHEFPAPEDAWSEPESLLEADVFAAATVLFLEPARSGRARMALRTALGGRVLELLTAYLAFIRTAHYWTLTHPDLGYEEDVERLMHDHEELTRLLLEDPEAGRCDMGEQLYDELMQLREEAAAFERLRRAEARQRVLIAELNHRVKNTLATVQAMAGQTLRAGEPPEKAIAAFTARLKALANAHDVLTRESWEGAQLTEVVAMCEVFGQDRIRAEGAPVRLHPRMALSLSMALHELATNAAKYGALSAEAGQVEISWEVREGPDGPSLNLRWKESGGPPVKPPARRGFGSRLLERGLAAELGGDVRLVYEPSGVLCAIDAPLQRSRMDPKLD